jgi:hypothetical protein
MIEMLEDRIVVVAGHALKTVQPYLMGVAKQSAASALAALRAKQEQCA